MSTFSLRIPLCKSPSPYSHFLHLERKCPIHSSANNLLNVEKCAVLTKHSFTHSPSRCHSRGISVKFDPIEPGFLSNNHKYLSSMFGKSTVSFSESFSVNSRLLNTRFHYSAGFERNNLIVVSKSGKKEKGKEKEGNQSYKENKNELVKTTHQIEEIPDDLSRKTPKRSKENGLASHEPPLQSNIQVKQKLKKEEKKEKKAQKRVEDGSLEGNEIENEGEISESDEFSEDEKSDHHKTSLQFWKENESLSEYNSSPYMNSVVKVFCIHTEPNFSLPWQKKRQFSSTGSGFVISGKKILTNAHCIEHYTQVKVKRRGDDKKFLAKVLAIGRECDIALLTIADDDFWLDIKPIKFGSLPHLQDAVSVIGYPIGGDTISVTSGVVSRIEVTSYVHASSELLGCQIDAAINSGNSGGPAFNENNECVGIAFQSLKSSDAENIGYIIPTPVIFHFLNDYERNGKYTGFPILGINWQKMENSALRTSLKMNDEQSGVLIRRVEPTSHAFNFLKEGDILMKFEDISLGNDGTVPFRTGERISFGFLVSQKFSGESVDVEILRDGQILNVSVLLGAPKRLIPIHINGENPSYFIVAGLVFTPVNLPYLESEYGRDYEYESPVRLLDRLLNGQSLFDEHQIVVLSQVLANDVNVGYEDTTNIVVVKVNGIEVKNIRHLASLVDACNDPYMKFDMEQRELIVLESKTAKAATALILAQYGIPADRSGDLIPNL